jgi:hypothetical protein
MLGQHAMRAAVGFEIDVRVRDATATDRVILAEGSPRRCVVSGDLHGRVVGAECAIQPRQRSALAYGDSHLFCNRLFFLCHEWPLENI